MSVRELRFREFLDELASGDRTPGGGSVAALATALAAGLLATIARASDAADWADARGIAAQAESLRERAARLAEENAREYGAALGAWAESGAEAGARRDFALGQAFARAAEPPLQIAEAAADVAQLAALVARDGDPSLRADAATAAALAAAAARAAAELVAVNLTASAGDERVVRARKEADEAARAADAAFAGG
jgi:formiminotetrahydrofolate cyclodeaminase